MPLYEYKCDRCGGVFEVIQKFSDAPVELHEGCGGHVERLLSVSALQFKGTGWYVTDYARKSGNGTTPAKSETKDSGGSGSGESKSGESKSGESKSDTSKPAATSTS